MVDFNVNLLFFTLALWVYTNLQPAGRFCGQAAAANSRAAI